MLKLRKVAVTGGLSCGKSSVCRILGELGAYVLSADDIVHQLLLSDQSLGREVINLLGPSIVKNKKIDRSRVAEIVFQDADLLKALEDLVHPAVYKELDKEYRAQQKEQKSPLFIAEIPLLFESGKEKEFDNSVAVVANQELCIKRFIDKTKKDKKEFLKRSERQLPLLEKALKADYVIMNSGSLSNLQETTKELFQELTEQY